MLQGPSTIPILQVRGNSAVVYDEYMFSSRYANKHRLRSRMRQNRKGRYSGKMTQGTRKRLTRCATLLAQVAKPKWITNPVNGQLQHHRLSFITLTVASGHNITAQDGHKLLLSHFLQWLRREHDVKTYIWKAELQRRGQLHYHVTTPTFIHYKDIRAKWNELQLKAGLLKEFAEKHGHTDPNSTDIHEVRHVKDMARYLVKELAKSMQNETATRGKLWDCSDNLAGVPYFSVQLTNYHELQLNRLRDAGNIKMFSGDRWTIIDFLHGPAPPDLLEDHEAKQMEKFLNEIINGPVQTELPFAELITTSDNSVTEWKPISQQTLF